MRTFNLLFSLLFLYPIFSFGQGGFKLPSFAKSGHCYAKSYFKPIFTKDTLVYPVLKNEFHESKVRSAKVDLVKKPAYWNIEMLEKRPCLNRLKITKSNSEIEEIIVALDTSDKSVFTYQKFPIEQLESGGNLEWQEIVCADRVTAPYLEKIERKLKDSGYLQDTSAIMLSWPDIKEAIVEYQIENDLPAIHFNKATIEQMGLDFIENPIGTFSNPSVEVMPTYEFPVFVGDPSDCKSCIDLVYETVGFKFAWMSFYTDFEHIGKKFSRKNYYRILEPIAGAIKRYPIVIDKSMDSFELKVFERKRIQKLGSLFEQREIAYGDLNKKRLRKICSALQSKGFFDEKNCKLKKMTTELSIAIVKFQIENNLFLGGLSIDTIHQLGIEW